VLLASQFNDSWHYLCDIVGPSSSEKNVALLSAFHPNSKCGSVELQTYSGQNIFLLTSSGKDCQVINW
jgi:hypothetical protein